jgi:hypothetical protein
MLDIDGFLTSTEFISQLATFLTAIWTAFFGTFLTNFLGSGTASV